MTEADWNSSHARCLGMALPGDQITEMSERGERIVGDTFAILLQCTLTSRSTSVSARANATCAGRASLIPRSLTPRRVNSSI